MNVTEVYNIFTHTFEYSTSDGSEHTYVSNEYIIATIVTIMMCLLLLILLFIEKQRNFPPKPFAYALAALMVMFNWMVGVFWSCCTSAI
uniref:Uncharacterized protein n=1 Tax=Trichobilharzia regenti TaxID=157069 RepID=A0AA85J4I3_TRIRE